MCEIHGEGQVKYLFSMKACKVKLKLDCFRPPNYCNFNKAACDGNISQKYKMHKSSLFIKARIGYCYQL